MGPPGPPGADGAEAIKNRYCWGASGSIGFQYRVVDYSSGDAMTWCAVWDVAAQYSGGAYYSAGQAGAAPGLCLVVYDVETYSGGYWEFRDDSPGARVVYRDTGSTYDGTVLTFPAANCTG